jgi:flagellar basal body-associated protein FliL
MGSLEIILIIIVLLLGIVSLAILFLYLLFEGKKDLILEYKADFEKGKQIVKNRNRK